VGKILTAVSLVASGALYCTPSEAQELSAADQAAANAAINVIRPEAIAAHMDHLGICRPAEQDSVCHGAWVNASGTSAVLEVARAFASLRRAPRRSIPFVFVTGEEKGLRGSDYFAHFPTVPIEKIVADVNIDGATGILFPNKDIVPLGVEHSSLSQNVQAAARKIGYTISPDPQPE